MIVRYPRPEALPPPSDRLVVVEASAGTGKTFFLEHRVVDLILAGARLDEILVVTFTDKAVAELRLRVRDLLDRMSRARESTDAASAWALDDDARTRLRAAVTAFDRASIFTIHGFCHRVLVEDAFAARRPLAQQQIADEVAFDAAFGALLVERFADHDRELLAAHLERGGTVETLRGLLLACARRGAPTTRALDPVRTAELGEALRARFGGAEQRARLLDELALRGNDLRYAPKWLDKIGAALEAYDLDGHPARVLAACDELRKPASDLVKRAAKHAAGALLADAIAAPTLDEILAGALLPPVLERAFADKAERGLFDYDDMLTLVRDALDAERGSELAARLRARTPWVLIDEFQDTDRVQWDIFRSVWLHAEARGLTIVGDPKQAIYGFRGADVATYLRARDELLAAGATRVTLATNRRTSAPLLAGVDAILLGGGLAPLVDRDGIRYDQPAIASGDVVVDGARPPITVFALPADATRDDSRIALAGAIGAEIERLRDAPPVWTLRGTAPAFSLAQVMVLTRSNKDSAQIAAALRARGLPCALVEPDRLFATREAHELADVLAAIAAPRDRSARMRAVRTRFFDVTWRDLMRTVDAPDHHPAIARIYDWAHLAVRRDYEPLFRRLVEDSRFAERALVLGGGERAIVNTQHVIELLLEEVARSRCDLHELVAQLRRWIASELDDPTERDVQRVETDAEAIRVLTMHKAKGLEAPFVFVFGAASKPPRSPVRWVERDDTGEHQRLAYVALTRAQVRLYLPRYGDKALDDASTYAQVQRCLAPLCDRKAAHLEIVPVTGVAAPAAPPPGALARLDVQQPPSVVELAALPAARVGLAMLSYTRLAREHDAAALNLGEVAGALDRAELDAGTRAAADAVGPDELPPGIDTGIFVHAVLEHADLAGVRAARDGATWAEAPEVRALLVEKARASGIAERYLPHAARIVHATLAEPLAIVGGDPLPPLAAAHAIAREVDFAYPIPTAAPAAPRGLARGILDALVAWPDDDRLWVVDYKTDVLRGADLGAAAADQVRAHYEVQARLYAIAADRVRGARRLAGLLYVFVRHGIAVALPTSDERIAAWTRWLAELPAKEPA